MRLRASTSLCCSTMAGLLTFWRKMSRRRCKRLISRFMSYLYFSLIEIVLAFSTLTSSISSCAIPYRHKNEAKSVIINKHLKSFRQESIVGQDQPSALGSNTAGRKGGEKCEENYALIVWVAISVPDRFKSLEISVEFFELQACTPQPSSVQLECFISSSRGSIHGQAWPSALYLPDRFEMICFTNGGTVSLFFVTFSLFSLPTW